MQRKQKSQTTHGSLAKGLWLLSAFIPDNREIGVVELSKLFSMNRSTVSRMAVVLKEQGFVRQNPENRKYSLGPRVASLAAAYHSSFQSTLTQLAKPYLDQLRSALNQTVILETPSEDRVVTAYVTEGLGPIKIEAGVGDNHYYHASAGGKCILAFSNEDFIRNILQPGLPQVTPTTIVNAQVLWEELEEIRSSSFAFDAEGNWTGINAFAVPVFDRDEVPVAAIVAAGAANIITWQEKKVFVEKLKATAAKICSLLNNGEVTSHKN